MGHQAAQDKPTAAFMLSLIGGIMGLIVSFVLIGIAWSINASSYYSSAALFSYFGAALFGYFGLWTLYTSMIVIVAALQLHSDPSDHKRWGVIILVCSIIGLEWWLPGIIGGIMTLVYEPESPRA
jgi:ABC-type nickel/cobalt efflux system permease component RcnA